MRSTRSVSNSISGRGHNEALLDRVWRLWAINRDAIAMDVQGSGKNVNLRIDYISRTMLGNVPDLLIDLLEVASYV